MDLGSLVTGGSAGGFVLALAYAWQQFQKSRADARAEPRAEATSAVTDAATANSLILAALQEEREDNARNAGRIAELETQNALLYEKIRDQRREYEREIAALRERVENFRQQLDALQQRLSTDPPLPEP